MLRETLSQDTEQGDNSKEGQHESQEGTAHTGLAHYLPGRWAGALCPSLLLVVALRRFSGHRENNVLSQLQGDARCQWNLSEQQLLAMLSAWSCMQQTVFVFLKFKFRWDSLLPYFPSPPLHRQICGFVDGGERQSTNLAIK